MERNRPACLCGQRGKFKKKNNVFLQSVKLLLWILSISFYIAVVVSLGLANACDKQECVYGTCDPGWNGRNCHHCGGRIRLTDSYGFISDGAQNYSVDMQCTWLIDSGRKNVTIRLHLLHFETECSWDHLYIFDGDSVYSPLIAAYSGVLVRDSVREWHMPEIVTHSGSAYLYFYSDAAFNMSGFNISYSIDGCPKNCSSHGPCVDNVCTCWADWTGKACDTPICHSGCVHGKCDREKHICICALGYKGVDCSYKEGDPIWELENTVGKFPGRALHQSIVFGDSMWVIGGEHFNQTTFHNVMRFDFVARKWEFLESNKDMNRYGHSIVLYQEKIYVYGGMLQNGTVTNDLWAFFPASKTWEVVQEIKNNQDCHPELCSPVATVGHTANIVGDRMFIIFGHNPVYGYMNIVQCFDISTGKWTLVKMQGAIVKGGFGHTSVYDKSTQLIYVYGGYHSFGSEASLVDLIYSLNPWEYTWRLLTPSLSPRYLHASVILNGMMLVFGGNTHNGTSHSGHKCFSSDLLAYDIIFDVWQTLKVSVPFHYQIARFGHSAIVHNGSIYVLGGFNGQMLKDFLKFTPGSCKRYATRESCENASPGVKCFWKFDGSICHSFAESSSSLMTYHPLAKKPGNITSLCSKLTSCPSCLENTYGCMWCGSSCTYGRCLRQQASTTLSRNCEEAESSNCDTLHNCQICHTEYHCGWQHGDKCYTFVRESGNKTEKAVLSDNYRTKCELPCSSRMSCENCTQGPCMWCSSQQRCVESNAYVAVFPVAQCMEWTTSGSKCSNPGLSCRDIKTCEQCQQNPRCGWCDDGSGTGLGMCTDGAYAGPVTWNQTRYVVDLDKCLRENWYFTTCPLCQCNGHSICINGTSICTEPCSHLTEGDHCQQCMDGYYGNPINGGNCTACVCNRHSDVCNKNSGKCNCSTKGIIGHHCEKCDEANHYFGFPKELGGSCFYNLSIDFQYTFNMTKEEDKYFSQINFMNSPPKPDVDVDFSVQCTTPALVNISMASALSTERILHENRKCGAVKLRFSHDELTFGLENTTFYVYVFDFKTPLVLQISFSQHRTLDLLQFFITFSSCFLSLLIIAAVLWKIKQKYDLYRRRQRLFVEMEQMASRPFSGVSVELEKDGDAAMYCMVGNRKKNHPTPVSLEPCAGGKAAILTLVVRLSNGGEEYAAAGQSSLAMGSALVSLGTLCKTTTNINSDVIKDDAKFDLRKSCNNSNTCI